MIRKATKKDIPRIAEILVFTKRTAYRSIFHDDLFSFNELQVLSVAEHYASHPELLENILVYDDGIVKGMISKGELPGDDETELHELYVDSFFKGIGIGSALLGRFCEDAEKEHKRRIYLWVLKDNLAARTFYEKNGFAANGQEQLVEGTSVIQMRYVKECERKL